MYMINMRKLQAPKGEYNQVTIKEYKDSKKCFWKITYHKYLKNTGLVYDDSKLLKEDNQDIEENTQNRVISKKTYDNICYMTGKTITRENIDTIIQEEHSSTFIDTDFVVYTRNQLIEYLDKLEFGKDFNSIKRAKNTVFEYASCNDFDYFITITLDPKKAPQREQLEIIYPIISQWFRDYKKKNKDFAYIILPEEHKSGGWHFHGLMRGIPSKDLVLFDKNHRGGKKINKKIDEGLILYDWIPWFKRFGFNDIEPIKNKEAVEKYITKYCTKELGSGIKKVNAQMYYCSKGLQKAKIIAKGTYSAKIDAQDLSFFDYVGDYCSVKTVKDIKELEHLKQILIQPQKEQQHYKIIDNMIVDTDSGEVLSYI